MAEATRLTRRLNDAPEEDGTKRKEARSKGPFFCVFSLLLMEREIKKKKKKEKKNKSARARN